MARWYFSKLYKGEMDGKGSLYQIFGDQFVESNPAFEAYIQDFTFIEFLFYGFEMIFDKKEFNYKDPLTMLFGHEDLTYHFVSYDKLTLNGFRLFMNGYDSIKGIKEKIDVYFSIPNEWRLYSRQDDKVTSNVPKYYSERRNVYHLFLNSDYIRSHRDIEKDIITDLDKERRIITGWDPKKSKQKKLVKQFFKSEWLTKKHDFPLTKLVRQRANEKKGFQDINNFCPNLDTYKELGASYVKRYERLKMFPIESRRIQPEADRFQLDQINHVIATTGAGKGTLIHGLAFEACKKGKKKILYFTDSTQATKKEKEIFEKLGLKVGDIVGSGKLKKHQNSYIQSKASTMTNPFDIFRLYKDDVDSLSTDCPLKHWLELDDEKSNPCQKIKLSGSKPSSYYICPAYRSCGYHRRYEGLLDADIWIGTPEAFLFSKAPYVWDKYERTFFELAILWSDLIVVDEVDNIQLRLDRAYLNDVKVFLDNKDVSSIDDYFCEHLFELIPNVVKSSTNDVFVQKYIDHVINLQSISHYIYGYLISEQELEDYLYPRLFTPLSLLRFWYRRNVDKSEVGAFRLFDEFNAEIKDNHSCIWKAIQRLQNMSKNIVNKDRLFSARKEFLNHLFDELEIEVSIPEKVKDERRLYFEFEFILCMFLINDLTGYLRSRYNDFIERAAFADSSKVRSHQFQFTSQDLYVPNALTNSFRAYRFQKNVKGRQWFSLVLHEYRGVGRKLLERMPFLFEGLEDHPTPAILMLSATSDFLDSTYFGVDVPPNWLLENKDQQEQDICITLYPVGQISGADDAKEAIQNATYKLIKSGFFEEEINDLNNLYQQEQKEAKMNFLLAETEDDQKRYQSILDEVCPCLGLVVNSYMKAEWIVEIFKKANFPYHFQVLYTENPNYNGQTIEKQDYHVSLMEVEKLYQQKPQVFVWVRSALSRGYNILAGPESSRSLIRTLAFYERPHPLPGNFDDVIAFIHANLNTYKSKIVNDQLTFYEAQTSIYQSAYKDLHKLFSGDQSFSNMDEELQRKVSTNELVIAMQTVGRGMRGGTSVKVFFLDSKMIPLTVENNSRVIIDTEETSMMIHWMKVLLETKDELTLRLNQSWINAMKNIKVKYPY